MNIFDREIVTTQNKNAKKAATQILESDIKPFHRVVAGSSIGQKYKKALMGGLTAADLGDKTYWDTLGDTVESRDKNYKGDAIQMVRWMSTVGEPNWSAWRKNGSKGKPPLSDSDLTAYHIIMTNEIVNIGLWELGQFPELQFKLMCIIGLGSKQNHHWLPMPGRKVNTDTKVTALFRRKYPNANDLEMGILLSSASKESITHLAKDYALDDTEIKAILKDFK